MSTSLSPFFLQVLNIQRDVIPNLGNFQPMCFGCRFRSWLKSFALSPPLCISISCRIIGQIPFSPLLRSLVPSPPKWDESIWRQRRERFNLRAHSKQGLPHFHTLRCWILRPQFGQEASEQWANQQLEDGQAIFYLCWTACNESCSLHVSW